MKEQKKIKIFYKSQKDTIGKTYIYHTRMYHGDHMSMHRYNIYVYMLIYEKAMFEERALDSYDTKHNFS